MAGQNWRKNKKGFMVNPEGKTARQVKQEKYAAKKAEAKAKASGASTDNLTWEQQKSLNALTGGKSPIFSKLSDKSKRELLKISDELEALNREADRDRVTGKGAWKRPSEASIKRSEKRSNRYRLLRNRVEALDDEKGTAKTASKGKTEAKAKVSGGNGSGGGEFTQKTVSILNREGKARKVKGEVLGDYVISAGGNDAYSIHHVPTGLEITSSIGFKTRNPAKYESLSEKEAARLAVRKLVDAKIDIPDSYSKWDKSSTDKKAKIGQAIVDAFDDKKTPAKPASRRPNKKISNRGD